MELYFVYLWGVLESLKIFLVFHYVMGFERRRNIFVFLTFLYPMLVLPMILEIDVVNLPIYKAIWLFVFPIIFFKGKLVSKTVFAMVVTTLISLLDIIVINSLTIIRVPSAIMSEIGDAISFLLIVMIAMMGRKYNKTVNEAIMSFKPIMNAGVFMVSFILYIWVGMLEIMFRAEAESRLSEFISVISIIVAAVTAFLVTMGIYYITRIRQMTVIDEYKSKLLDINQQYVDALIERERDLRSYRHDFNNHMILIKSMASEHSDGEIVKYIESIFSKYEIKNVISVGNKIANLFVNKVLSDMDGDEDFVCDVKGKIPDYFKMDNVDMCTLMSNIMDNVHEALKKFKGRKKLKIEITHYEQMLYIDVNNSALPEDKALMSLKKEPGHGFGVKKIRDVVERNGGVVQWIYDDNMMLLKIELPIR